jgi:hypothetical protein
MYIYYLIYYKFNVYFQPRLTELMATVRAQPHLLCNLNTTTGGGGDKVTDPLDADEDLKDEVFFKFKFNYLQHFRLLNIYNVLIVQ